MRNLKKLLKQPIKYTLGVLVVLLAIMIVLSLTANTVMNYVLNFAHTFDGKIDYIVLIVRWLILGIFLISRVSSVLVLFLLFAQIINRARNASLIQIIIGIATTTLIVFILVVGLFVPLGSHTTTSGSCPSDPIKQRLHLFYGKTLEEVKNASKNARPSRNSLYGCSMNVEYTLYLL